MNRRSFVRSLSAATAVGLFNAPCRGEAEKRPPTASDGPPSRVVIVRRPGLSELTGKAKADAYQAALSAALSALGPDSSAHALAGRRTVGLKLNCLAGRPLSPCQELAEALASLLRDSGAREVTAWERSRRELTRAGFGTGGAGFATTATDAVGYSRELFEQGAVGSLVSSALLHTDALVSVGVIKDHDLSGISCSLKNLYGVIHNPNKYHGNNCDPYVAEVAMLAPVRERLCLTVLDGAVAQCHGGPSYKPAWAWNFDGVLVSRDPVAADRIGHEMIEARRAARGLPSLAEANRRPSWIETAGRMGVGEHRRDAIEVREVTL
ncbi:MAG: DUF362 domain-containing protein [Candidatus Eisenbacteria bacterium]|jgi:uncharacterized protein (DUF362 family)|nr:DUF362 domain-containing protein [Candidatus Eisenbacteria bacterium]